MRCQGHSTWYKPKDLRGLELGLLSNHEPPTPNPPENIIKLNYLILNYFTINHFCFPFCTQPQPPLLQPVVLWFITICASLNFIAKAQKQWMEKCYFHVIYQSVSPSICPYLPLFVSPFICLFEVFISVTSQ